MLRCLQAEGGSERARKSAPDSAGNEPRRLRSTFACMTSLGREGREQPEMQSECGACSSETSKERQAEREASTLTDESSGSCSRVSFISSRLGFESTTQRLVLARFVLYALSLLSSSSFCVLPNSAFLSLSAHEQHRLLHTP